MITQLSPPLENSLTADLPSDDLYRMMGSMKFTIDRELEMVVVRKFNISMLTKISPNTTPVDHITSITRTALYSYMQNIATFKNIF